MVLFNVYSREVKREVKLNCRRSAADIIMHFRGALLVNCRSVTHMRKDGICSSVLGTPAVHRTVGADSSQALLPLVQFLKVIIKISHLADFYAAGVSCRS